MSSDQHPSVRFGCQYTQQLERTPIDVARAAEAAGFDVFLVSDHVGPGLAPLPVLAAVAAATETIRLGTLVLNVTMRNPVQLAWEATTIDQLSHGRFELGLGAGHTPQEYAATGIELTSPRARKSRLAEQTEIIRRLLDGETVDHRGAVHTIAGAAISQSVQGRLPILVGGNGVDLLGHAGAHADIVGLQGLGRTLEDGHSHTVRWSSDRLDEQIGQVRTGAGERFDQLTLSAMVQVVHITDDAEASLAAIATKVDGISVAELDEIPYVLVGTVEEIAGKIERCRHRFGISYYTVRSVEAFAPVIAAVRSGNSQ